MMTLVEMWWKRLRWPSIARDLQLTPSKVVGHAATPRGMVLNIRLSSVVDPEKFHAAERRMANAYRVASCSVEANDEDASVLRVFLNKRASVGMIAYPTRDWRRVWVPSPVETPIPLGVHDDGSEFRLSLYGHSLLIGGSTGGGKSNAERAVLAGLACKNYVALIGVDAKRVELNLWRQRFSALVTGADAQPVIEVLEWLNTEIYRRLSVLEERRLLVVEPSAEMPMLCLVIDELAEMGVTGSKAERDRIQQLLRSYQSVGRAVGCSMVACTQKPTSDAGMDPTTRALIPYRLAMRCGDRWQSESIIGTADAATIPASAPGRAYFSDGGTVKSVQVYYVDPSRIADEFLCQGLRVELSGMPSKVER
jgi:hypothetical protein